MNTELISFKWGGKKENENLEVTSIFCLNINTYGDGELRVFY